MTDFSVSPNRHDTPWVVKDDTIADRDHEKRERQPENRGVPDRGAAKSLPALRDISALKGQLNWGSLTGSSVLPILKTSRNKVRIG